MGYINDQEWNMYNTTINNLNEVTLNEFQFKLNNKILSTKTFVHEKRKDEDNLCSYCKREPETIFTNQNQNTDTNNNTTNNINTNQKICISKGPRILYFNRRSIFYILSVM